MRYTTTIDVTHVHKVTVEATDETDAKAKALAAFRNGDAVWTCESEPEVVDVEEANE